jgi:CheY-like chemotaxis protein/anti-sigma regulatory factor (Ser/Thr protein kinase)
VVANLVTNAAKYTEAGGDIAIEARAEGEHVVLSVRDSGVGIDPEMLPQIFNLFVQEPQTLARSQGGLGLGLAIVRSLVELHGGTVTASSAGKGRGSQFTLRLPRVQTAQVHEAAGERPADVVAQSGARVLIVDDNADAATLLGALVREFGYDTRVVFDAPSALSEAERFEPQLALVDLGLPVMNGFELASRFADHPRLRQAKLVAVTGYGQQHDRDQTTRAGFAAHLVKPVDGEALRTVLNDLMAAPDGESIISPS